MALPASRWPALASAGVTLFILTACDRHLVEGPIVARVTGDVYQFVLCETASVGEIFVEERQNDVCSLVTLFGSARESMISR